MILKLRSICESYHLTIRACQSGISTTTTATSALNATTVATTSSAASGSRYSVYVASRNSTHLRWMFFFVVDHIPEKSQCLIVSHIHWSARQLNLKLSFCWCRKIRLDLVDEHPNFHQIGMHDSSFSFDVSVKSPDRLLFELGPPHVRRFFTGIDKILDIFVNLSNIGRVYPDSFIMSNQPLKASRLLFGRCRP